MFSSTESLKKDFFFLVQTMEQSYHVLMISVYINYPVLETVQRQANNSVMLKLPITVD